MSNKERTKSPLVWRIMAVFWVPHKIDSWNFQQMKMEAFPETSQTLGSFWQVLFSIFQRKPPKTCQDFKWGFLSIWIWYFYQFGRKRPSKDTHYLFFYIVILDKNKNKSCQNEPKLSAKVYIYWKFQLSLTWGAQKAARIPKKVILSFVKQKSFQNPAVLIMNGLYNTFF